MPVVGAVVLEVEPLGVVLSGAVLEGAVGATTGELGETEGLVSLLLVEHPARKVMDRLAASAPVMNLFTGGSPVRSGGERR